MEKSITKYETRLPEKSDKLIPELCLKMCYLIRRPKNGNLKSGHRLYMALREKMWIKLKKDDASFKSKSEADSDNSSPSETSPTNNISQTNENVKYKKLMALRLMKHTVAAFFSITYICLLYKNNFLTAPVIGFLV